MKTHQMHGLEALQGNQLADCRQVALANVTPALNNVSGSRVKQREKK